MKIINLKTPVEAGDLKNYLQEEMTPLFKKQRLSDLTFNYTQQGNSIEITQPDLYEGFLFQIEVNGTELHIIKSEHYTDDVNVLTLEDIMNNLLMEYPGRDDIKFIGEES